LASFVFFMKAIGRMSKYRDELSWPFYAALIFAVPVLVAVAALPLMVIIAVLSLFSGRGLHG